MNRTLISLLGNRASTIVVAALVAAAMAFAAIGGASAHGDVAFGAEGHYHGASTGDRHDAGVVHCHASASCAVPALIVDAGAIDDQPVSIGSRHADMDAIGLTVSPDDPPPIH